MFHGFAGLLAFSKEAWIKSEDIEDLKRVNRAEDTHLHLAIKKIKPTKHINTDTIHLRPREDHQSHYNRGVAQCQMLHSHPIKPFLHSVMMLRPAVFTGYMHARRGLV
jgi:PP-loop superfamily ATP-utilizing enzyme